MIICLSIGTTHLGMCYKNMEFLVLIQSSFSQLYGLSEDVVIFFFNHVCIWSKSGIFLQRLQKADSGCCSAKPNMLV